MGRPVFVQLGLFGGCSEVVDMHTVAAHTRVLADGSEVFVGEHLRWNRGQQEPRPRAPRLVPAAPADHPTLFDRMSQVEPEERVEALPRARGTAVQLDLWAPTPA